MNLLFKFGKSIRSKLILSFIVLCSLSLLISNLITHYTVSKETKKSYISSTEKEIQQIDMGINNYVSTIIETTKLLTCDPNIKNIDSRITSYVNKQGNNGFIEMTPLQSDPYEASLYTYFQSLVKNYSLIDAVTVAVAENGGFVKYPAVKRNNGYDPRTRDWYKLAVNDTSKVHLTDVHTTSTGDMVMSTLFAITDNVNVKGVLTLDFSPKQLSSVVEKIKLGKSGYVILTDKNGNILANPKDKKTLLKNIKDLNIKGLNDINDSSRRELTTKLSDGNTYIINIQKSSNKDLGWNYISFIQKDELMESANKITNINYVILLICIIFSSLMGIFISNKISRPINIVSSHLKTLGEGDFTVQLESKYLELEDEIGQIARMSTKLQTFLRNVLLNVKSESSNIENNSESLHSSLKEINSSSKQVSSAVQETSKGMCNQSENLSQIVAKFNDFGNEIKQVIKELYEIDCDAQNINSTAYTSNDKLKNLNTSMYNINKSFNSFSDKIIKLNANVKQINEIINLINNIANQTNLLALNAAIEASRAGEYGKSFAVVAEEIRKLAEQSKTSSENITSILNTILNNTHTIVNDNQIINEEFSNQLITIDESIVAFENIVNMVDSVSSKLQLLNSSTTNIEKDRDIILNSIEEISGVSEEISASCEEISASSENIDESINGILTISQELNNSTKSMMNDVNTVKIHYSK